MVEPVRITLLGQPVPWARSGGNGKVRFTPQKQRNNAATLRIVAQHAMIDGEHEILDHAVRMDVSAEFQMPKSWSKKKKNAAIIGLAQHTVKPDLDNIVKQIKDACKGVVYTDDARISELHARKVYGVQPKLVITVTQIAD